MYHIYEGETLSQALLKMQIDIGKDAIIVDHTHKKKGGIFGLFGHGVYQVRAIEPEKRPPGRKLAAKLISDIGKKKGKKPQIDYVVTDEREKKIKNTTAGIYSRRRVLQKTENISSSEDIKNVVKEEVKTLLDEIVKKKNIKYPGKLSEVYVKLIESEVEENLADILINKARSELTEDELDNLGIVQDTLIRKIVELLTEFSNKEKSEERTGPEILVLVGPTGVGKTTTIAKLGAIYSIKKKKDVAFLTIDTYRLAAVEQLQKYSNILGCNLKVIFQPKEIDESITNFKDKDILLVDTAGRSPHDEEKMEELRKFVSSTHFPLDTYLVLSATTKFSDIKKIAEKFSKVKYNRLIFSKMDETLTFGSLLNAVNAFKVPVDYVTFGQEVPDDISRFDPEKIAKRIVQE